jgi:hypothetical protein
MGQIGLLYARIHGYLCLLLPKVCHTIRRSDTPQSHQPSTSLLKKPDIQVSQNGLPLPSEHTHQRQIIPSRRCRIEKHGAKCHPIHIQAVNLPKVFVLLQRCLGHDAVGNLVPEPATVADGGWRLPEFIVEVIIENQRSGTGIISGDDLVGDVEDVPVCIFPFDFQSPVPPVTVGRRLA